MARGSGDILTDLLESPDRSGGSDGVFTALCAQQVIHVFILISEHLINCL